MNDEKPTPKTKYDSHPIDVVALRNLAGIGVVSGILGWLLYMAVSQFFIEPVFCRNVATYSVCRSGGTIAWAVAHIIVLAASVAVLARLAVYRPLLVVLAVFISLWSSHAWLGEFSWYISLGWQALLFGLAFVVFGWIARSTSFLVAVIASVVLVVLARLALISA